MKAVLIVSHGSRSEATQKELENLVVALKGCSGIPIIDYAFLEIASPSIPKGIARCVDRGAKEVLIALNFLNSGQHVDVDIPLIIEEAQCQYPDVHFKITQALGQHPGIIDVFLQLIKSSQ